MTFKPVYVLWDNFTNQPIRYANSKSEADGLKKSLLESGHKSSRFTVVKNMWKSNKFIGSKEVK